MFSKGESTKNTNFWLLKLQRDHGVLYVLLLSFTYCSFLPFLKTGTVKFSKLLMLQTADLYQTVGGTVNLQCLKVGKTGQIARPIFPEFGRIYLSASEMQEFTFWRLC